MAGAIDVTLFTDPGCPWAYSATPALTVMRWRYGDQLRWRLVMIGLTENPEQYVARGYTPTRAAMGQLMFRERYGMPFAPDPRERVLATTRGCRAVIAARLLAPGRELAVLRALQFAWFTTKLLLDEDYGLVEALERVAGIDAESVVATLEDPAVLAAYEADKQLTRTAEGRPIDFQGKARQTDGPVRYSAPSVIFRSGEREIEAGGFQPVEAYDLAVANVDASLSRTEPPESPLAALERFPDGLTTQELAAVMAPNNTPPDRVATEAALVELRGGGAVRRVPLGDDALWLPA
ncbi:MAG: DsbA family protein [Solirubrobacteraceae bacterium]